MLGGGGPGDRGIRLTTMHSYLLGLPEEAPGAAVVDVYPAQAFKWSSHSDVWGGKTKQSPGIPGPLALSLSAAGHRAQRGSDLTLAKVFRATANVTASELWWQWRLGKGEETSSKSDSRAVPHISQHNPVSIFSCHPIPHFSRHLGSNDIFYQDQKRSHSPSITASTQHPFHLSLTGCCGSIYYYLSPL